MAYVQVSEVGAKLEPVNVGHAIFYADRSSNEQLLLQALL
jgi:hypothetical protein